MIDVFTAKEVAEAKKILSKVASELQRDNAAKLLTNEVMKRINESTGQKNLREYMAYRLLYIATIH